jgi:hypothetical protein
MIVVGQESGKNCQSGQDDHSILPGELATERIERIGYFLGN